MLDELIKAIYIASGATSVCLAYDERQDKRWEVVAYRQGLRYTSHDDEPLLALHELARKLRHSHHERIGA